MRIERKKNAQQNSYITKSTSGPVDLEEMANYTAQAQKVQNEVKSLKTKND